MCLDPTHLNDAKKWIWRRPLFTLDLPSDIEKRLLVLAMHKGRTVQFCAREAILDYIDEVEERFLAVDRISEEGAVDRYDPLD
jgi:RHH-type rel operon transcriptional repressor/antitoxin RelB